MTAGTGVTHSESNPSRDEAVHLLQIWILPEAKNLEPSYEQKAFTDEQKRGRLCLVASRDGRDGSVTIHQDASVYTSVLAQGEAVTHELRPGRHAWLQVARGAVAVNGENLEQGDGAAISGEEDISVASTNKSEILLFDLA
jgi:redox-sensitive bicupin YhaK (pirin superfamily)